MANQRNDRRRNEYELPRRPANRRPPRRFEEGDRGRSRNRERSRYEEFDHRYERPNRRYEGERPYREPPYQKRRYQERSARPMRGYSEQEYYPPNQGRPRPQRPINGTNQNANTLKQAKSSTNKKIFMFIYNLLFYTLMIGIILSAVMFAFSEKSNAAIMGYRFYQVLTDSMAPQKNSPPGGFYSGDMVIVRATDGSKVEEGDVVTFQVGDGKNYLTHRLVEKLTELNGEKGDYIVTQGDANSSKDPPISADRVFGKVVFVIPKAGKLIAFVQSNPWLCLVCALSTFGFFLVLKAYILEPNKKQQQVYGYNHL